METLDALGDTVREISLEEVTGKRYSPLRFHADTFRHMDDLRGVLEDLLGEMQRLRLSCNGMDLDWYARTTVDAVQWPS
jgi:hypothetical protein